MRVKCPVCGQEIDTEADPTAAPWSAITEVIRVPGERTGAPAGESGRVPRWEAKRPGLTYYVHEACYDAFVPLWRGLCRAGVAPQCSLDPVEMPPLASAKDLGER